MAYGRDDLGNRMKTYYEDVFKTKLMRRTPVIIRIDGRDFHTFTKNFARPYDTVLAKSMQETMLYLCENISGCAIGYTQSDEISLLLIDYARLNTKAWFNYEVQKMSSVVASMATMAFNKRFMSNVNKFIYEMSHKQLFQLDLETNVYATTLENAVEQGAMFDARVFNIPREEVTNYFYWRQLDASINSINMVAQANFTHDELHAKSCNDMQDMLMTIKGINWNDFPTTQKRGSCAINEDYFKQYGDYDQEHGVWKKHWIIDNEIPIFKGDGREYIERLINVE